MVFMRGQLECSTLVVRRRSECTDSIFPGTESKYHHVDQPYLVYRRPLRARFETVE